ncbi:MAG: hypothetical protein ACOVLD_00755, partial [Bacteroidia bacterium]
KVMKEHFIVVSLYVDDKKELPIEQQFTYTNKDGGTKKIVTVGDKWATFETENFRNNVIPLGITSMSAGSKTNPGGYAVEPESLEQFEISDERDTATIAQLIRNHGYEAVWKDWDRF